MSVGAITWAYRQKIARGRSGAKFVLVTLANFADGDGFCYPGQGRLAALTSMSERAVRAHLAYLENNLGLINREHRRGDGGKWTSDGFMLLAPAEDLNDSNSDGRQNLPQAKSAVGRKRPAAKSAANTKENKDDTKEHVEAQPAASPRGGDDERGADHRRGMTFLHERCGPIPNPAAQGAALKWLLSHYPLEQCCECLDALLEEDWRTAAVSWLTVKKEIGTWLARKEKTDGGNGRPEKNGGRDHAQAGAGRATYTERRASSRATARRQYEDDSI